MGTSRLEYVSPQEANPFASNVPASIQELDLTLFNHLSNLQTTLRAQYNSIQNGDATQPWQLTTGLANSAQFALGALGRFMHPMHGAIFCRYVKFAKIDSNLWSGAPFGYVGPNIWEVSNRLNESNADRIAGLSAAFKTPANGQFGWVIIQGINTQSVSVAGSAPQVGQQLQWHSNGKLTTGLNSKPVGAVISIDGLTPAGGDLWDLAPGMIQLTL